MRSEIPTACDRGAKCKAQGYKMSWNDYKLHLDTADCGVPVAALLFSASMHDSRATIPLSLRSAQRVTHLYDLMDTAHCSRTLREHSRSLGHVPLIDHNPRQGEKSNSIPPRRFAIANAPWPNAAMPGSRTSLASPTSGSRAPPAFEIFRGPLKKIGTAGMDRTGLRRGNYDHGKP
jgi:hypothetical protein